MRWLLCSSIADLAMLLLSIAEYDVFVCSQLSCEKQQGGLLGMLLCAFPVLKNALMSRTPTERQRTVERPSRHDDFATPSKLRPRARCGPICLGEARAATGPRAVGGTIYIH